MWILCRSSNIFTQEPKREHIDVALKINALQPNPPNIAICKQLSNVMKISPNKASRFVILKKNLQISLKRND